MLNDGLVALDGGKGVQPAEHIRQMAERSLELLVGLVAHLGERAECGDIGKEANAVHLADVRRAHRDVPELGALLLRQRHQARDRVGERAVAAETDEPLVVRGVLFNDLRRRARRGRIKDGRAIPVQSERRDCRAEIEIGH